MPLLVVSPALPDAPVNGLDFRKNSLLNDLHHRQLEPIAYPLSTPTTWMPEPGAELLSPNLDDDYVGPWFDLYTHYVKQYGEILFDLRRYKGLIPHEACLFFKYGARSSSFCMALADESDHDLLQTVCRARLDPSPQRIYASIATMANARRFAVA